MSDGADPDRSGPSEDDDASGASGAVGAIDGAVLLLAAGKASVAPQRLPDLVERAAARLRDRVATYRRTRERVHADGTREIYLVDRDHWSTLGDELGFDERETDAVRRAHEEQLLHVGRRTGREEEFDHALEIREPVVVGRTADGANPASGDDPRDDAGDGGTA